MTNANGAFTRTTLLGIGDFGPVYVTARWDGRRLSLMGVEGPKRNGDCLGGCGQITPSVTTYVDGWNADKVTHLKSIWESWHLNDLRAGCKHQRAAKWSNTRVGDACPECGYRYGTEWLYEAVPSDVIEWLRNMPDSHTDDWGRSNNMGRAKF